MKNDITYEYRVFTNRLIDVESMEVGKCTSKVIKELKQKDKVDGRFFHTSDTDEWFFCWNGKLQKLNLKGNSDVNAALAEVRELIKKAETSVDNVNKIAQEAKTAAADAKTAADAATAAAGKIEDKADKSDVEDVLKVVDEKADRSVVDELSAKVDAIKVPSLEGYATEKFVGDAIAGINIPTVPTKVSELENDAKYLTEHQSLDGYATEKWVGEQGYITEENLKDAGKSIFDAAGAASSAETTAKAYADGLKTEMNARIDVLEAINHDAYVAADVQVLPDAKTYANGLATNYDAAGSASSAEQNAKDYVDSKLASIEEELKKITNKILGV